MRAKVVQAVRWVASQIRALRDVPRAVLHWLRSHASRCVASVWLSGMGIFGITTIRRVVAAQVAEAPAAVAPRSDGAVETVAMLDVDEINGIRTRRLHALGLAAAGDRDAPDDKTIEEARAAQAHGIELDGERVATAGKIVVVTRGGIAGWLKRNRGKTADPETLAWLRGEEAAEGRASYAGWADRADGSILNWAKDRRRAGTAQTGHGGVAPPGEPADKTPDGAAHDPGTAGSGDSPAGAVHDDRGAGSADVQPAAVREARGAGSGDAQTPAMHETRETGSGHAQTVAVLETRGAGSGDAQTPAMHETRGAGSGDAQTPAMHETREAGSGHAQTVAMLETRGAGSGAAETRSGDGHARSATVHRDSGTDASPVVPSAAPDPARSVAVAGIELRVLGGAAASAFLPQAPADPHPDQLASLRERLRPFTTAGAIALSVRDHRVVLVLLCDQLFAHGRAVLTTQGAQVVRGLGRVLAEDRGRAYNLSVDAERAFELVSNLAIAGLAPERVELALKTVDRAIDVVEVEWIDGKDTP